MKTIVVAVIIWTLATAAAAKPVPEAERIPVDVRRTTFIVKDAGASLPLYRDALGMKVIYDQVLESGDPKDTENYKKRRLVLLRANDDFIGVLGLLQYMAPVKPEHRDRFDVPVPGDPIVVINADNLQQVWPKVVAVPGLEVISPPERIEYPRASGGTIAVMQSMIRDPNGYWIEINKILDAPAGLEK
ncbi:VOC family protein [Exilibacterium tricleocarpae]|uniref:VOC family protein n=1 Tax=Exilibacterium tricleocarpae TaxID=2591008 RepID=A0A545TVK3_9GAMM|nr:VOC family protein [Exilibacterium tricleocarpae]TQV81232.1 VOC family protein [Exilibacterium tricleocarpae]